MRDELETHRPVSPPSSDSRRNRPSMAAYRRRRLALSAWRQVARWEFWPTWALYPPVVAYLGALMARHRSITLFTLANPGITGGGFVGESKWEILQALSASGDRVAEAALLPGGLALSTKLSRASAFIEQQRTGFPIVLKPDKGQRGSGVMIVRTWESLRHALARSPLDMIIQRYVPGLEFGVFYCRRPSAPRGRIISVTEKRLPKVTGDGRSTLEQLILADDRAVCLARLHLARHRHSLQRVPRAGEEVPLVELGTHSRGAVFRNGRFVLSPALEAAVDDVAQRFKGFFFGRFDVRTPSIEAFRAGFFRVVELNGVTSEPTHIYHPGAPLRAAYRALFEQWRLAFEIGAENRARGLATTPLRTLVRLAVAYRKGARLHLTDVDVAGSQPGIASAG